MTAKYIDVKIISSFNNDKNIPNRGETIKKLAVESLLGLIKALAALKNFLAAFLAFFFKPLWAFCRFIFFRLSVKLYSRYFSFARKVGLSRARRNILAFLLGQKAVHLLVVGLVALFFTVSLLESNNLMKPISEKAGKTIVAGLVASEFTDAPVDEELIQETADEQAAPVSVPVKYLNEADVAVNRLGISTSTPPEEERTLADLSEGRDEMLIKPEVATTKKSKKTRKEPIDYIVQPGDSVSTIAADFDISVNTILWENGLTAYSLIRPGNKLVILPETGITYTVAKGDNLGSISGKYDVAVEDILAANNLPEDATIARGQKLFLPGGRKIYAAPPAPAPSAIAKYNPLDVIKDILRPDDAKEVPANKMAWPTVGHIITQYFTWRHHGLDVANKVGTPIYAADAGTVVAAGWRKDGYGNCVDIDHGGGKKTRYAHATKIFVKVGDVVKKGEAIAAMGSTGKSTGPHLHFEVRINNVTQNPLNYTK